MKNKKITSIVLLCIAFWICVLNLSACGSKQCTVTWKNYNGDVLDVTVVNEGEVPTFDKETPCREGNSQYSYVFAGWSPKVSAIDSDTTYTAQYNEIINSYTVVWKNYDGQVLQTTNLTFGALPSYNGATPAKQSDNSNISYVFAGWTPSVDTVTGDTVYTAKFVERNNAELTVATDVILSQDGKTAQYGLYPQTRISDEALISALEATSPSNVNGWYLYNGKYYAKATADVYNNETYTFDDGTEITNGQNYWFECEPIDWLVVCTTNGTYTLLCCKLLDNCYYSADLSNNTVNDNAVYCNNYLHCDLRDWLNGTFYNTAFALNNAYVQTTVVNNGAATTDSATNAYVCDNTQDNVYLLSYQDYINADMGFDSNALAISSARECKTTDYARATGAWSSKATGRVHNGSYWTRSPSSEFYYSAWNVDSGGVLSEYAVNGAGHCVRPCICITFDN